MLLRKWACLKQALSWRRRLAFRMGALSICLIFTSAKSAENLYQIRDELSFKQALAQKGFADEQFLSGRLLEAKHGYLDARENLHNPSADSSTSREQKDLFELEINYRLALLERNLPFFYNSAIRTITNPISIRSHFESNLAELIKVKNDLLDLEGKLQSDSIVISKERAEELKANEHLEVSQLNEAKADAIEDFNIDRRNQFDARIGQIKSRRQALVAEAKQQVSSIEAVQKQTNTLALTAITSALGLPDVQQLTKNKLDAKSVLKLTASLSGPDSAALSESLGTLGAAAENVVEVYRSANELKGEIDKGLYAVEEIRKFAADPSLASLISVGATLDGYLPPDLKQQVDTILQTTKPLAAIVKLGGVTPYAREAIDNYLSKQPKITEAIDRVETIFSVSDVSMAIHWYSDVLESSIKEFRSAEEAQKESIDQLLRGWPKVFFDQLGSSDALLAKTGVKDKKALVDRLANDGIQILGKIQIVDDELSLVDTGQKILISEMLLHLSIQSFYWHEADALKKINSSIAALTALKPEAINQIKVKRLPQVAIETLMARVITATDRSKQSLENLYSEILGGLESQKRKQIDDQMRRLVIGSVIAGSKTGLEANNRQGNDAKNVLATRLDRKSTSSKATAEQVAASVALGALSVAFPAIGAAIVAVKIIDGLGQINSLVNHVNEITNEVNQLVQEELRLRDLYDEAQQQVQLNDYERRISKQSQRIAKQSLILYQNQMTETAASMSETRFRMKMKEARLFLYMELLRRDFALLNDSLGLWGLPTAGPLSRVAAAIESDPQFLRLALDSEIVLFDWLDANKIPNRHDYESVVEHWQRLKVIIDEACNDLGCAKDKFEIGETNAAPEISVLDVLSSGDQERFHKWQKDQNGNPFEMWLDLRSDRQLGNKYAWLNESYTNVRVVSVGLAGLDGAGKRQRLLNIEIYHPGTSFIPTPEGGFVETRTPVVATSIPRPEDLDIAALKARWIAPEKVENSVFEGYGTYALWKLKLFPNDLVRSLKDLRLQFIIQYFNPATLPVGSAQQRIEIIDNVDFQLEASYLRTLGSPEEAQRKVKKYKDQILGSK
jgi:hypothetical protein